MLTPKIVCKKYIQKAVSKVEVSYQGRSWTRTGTFTAAGFMRGEDETKSYQAMKDQNQWNHWPDIL